MDDTNESIIAGFCSLCDQPCYKDGRGFEWVHDVSTDEYMHPECIVLDAQGNNCWHCSDAYDRDNWCRGGACKI